MQEQNAHFKLGRITLVDDFATYSNLSGLHSSHVIILCDPCREFEQHWEVKACQPITTNRSTY